MMIQLSAILLYFCLAFAVGFTSYRKQTSSADFLIGNRSLNSWLTALAAHASDMGNWLFMAYPALIFTGGLSNSWIAIGLLFCMLLNWQWVAPKIRTLTEKTGSLTLSSFFETRLKDESGLLRLFSAAICFLFYTVYVAAGLIGLGYLAESLFGISYTIGISIGIGIVITYVLIGGFVTLAWLDLFQGLFLLGVILLVPLLILPQVGGWGNVSTMIAQRPPFAFSLKGLFLCFGWGLGYFGQPHIITKFMGIRDVSKIKHSKRVGMSWMALSLSAATFMGVIAIPFFSSGIADPEMVFVEIVKQHFSPFAIGFILCAIVAAIINVMSSQLLVISSILSEDFYKKLFPKTATEKKLLFVSRMGIFVVALLALFIAFIRPASIYQLVLYAWSGLGATFGPLLLYLLYGKRITRGGAWASILSGAITTAVWPYMNGFLPIAVEPLLPAFLLSLGLNWGVSRWIYSKESVQEWA